MECLKTVAFVALFEDAEDADNAIGDFNEIGITRKQIETYASNMGEGKILIIANSSDIERSEQIITILKINKATGINTFPEVRKKYVN